MIPTNADSFLAANMSSEKMLEYITLKSQVADSSLDSLALAWMYRDTVVSLNVTVPILLAMCFVCLFMGVYLGENP